MMKRIILTAAVFAVLLCNVNSADLETWYEKSGCLETPRYDETVSYCKLLAEQSKMVKYESFGKSPQGRDLPLLIVDRNGNFTPGAVRRSGNAVLLIQACIHAGEPEGKDAGLTLIRDIITKKEMETLIDGVTVIFIPIFSVDGHERFGPHNRINQNGPKEMGWRTTAQNYNLNRDYMKADAPEMKAWLALFNEWLPDFFIDCHTTDGADYQYVLTYGLETGGNMDENLTRWQKEVYLPYVTTMMEKSGFPIFPYVFFRNWHDPRSGIGSWASSPLLSQGYTALQNRPGLLIETHMLKPYKPRVEATYCMIKHTMELLKSEKQNLRKLVEQSDEYTRTPSFRAKEYPLGFNNAFKDSTMMDFKGIDYEVTKSDLTGGDWIKYNGKQKMYRIPFFGKIDPVNPVKLPEAYIIPAEWTDIIDRLKLHAVKMTVLKKPRSIKVKYYKFSNVKFRNTPYEGHQTLTGFDLEENEGEWGFPAGSVIIDMNQRTAKIVAHLLEPKAQASFVGWGYMNAIFEQKEYSEQYVMEPLARKMLAEDPALKAEFENKMKSDSVFASNPWTMLNWFYSHTPYWDNRFNCYPVGRVFDRKIIDAVLKEE